MTTSYYTLACEHDVKHLRFRINNYYAMQWFKYASTVCKSFPNGDDCCRVYVSSLTVWCDDKVLNSQLSLVNTLYGVVRRKCSAQLLDLLTFYYPLCNSEHLAFYVICTVDVVVSRAVKLWIVFEHDGQISLEISLTESQRPFYIILCFLRAHGFIDVLCSRKFPCNNTLLKPRCHPT